MLLLQQKTTLIISIIIHSLLFLIFFLVKINWEIIVPEFIEIQFERGKSIAVPEYSSEVKNRNDKLDLPIRRTFEPEEEKINISDRSKVIPEEETQVFKNKIDEKLRIESSYPLMKNEKRIADLSSDTKFTPDLTEGLKFTNDESPFEIQGKAAQRKILVKIIPQYPENIQQEAIVKIRFSVLPNGLIGDMIPIIKGNDFLERITLEAFKQWRFNPLPQNVPQLPEQGTITFKYLLK